MSREAHFIAAAWGAIVAMTISTSLEFRKIERKTSFRDSLNFSTRQKVDALEKRVEVLEKELEAARLRASK